MRAWLLLLLLAGPAQAQLPWREPQHAVMPNLTGQTVASARQSLSNTNVTVLYAKGHTPDVVFRQYPPADRPLGKEAFLYVGVAGESVSAPPVQQKPVPPQSYVWGPQAFAASQVVFALAIFLYWRRRSR